MEVALAGLCLCHPSYLLDRFMLLWRLSITSWLIVSLSSLIFYSISSSVYVITPMMLLLVFSGSLSCLVVVQPFNELGWVSSLYELFYFVLHGPKVLCVMIDTVMVSIVFGQV